MPRKIRSATGLTCIFEFHPLSPRSSEVERVEQSVEANDVGQIIKKIGRADTPIHPNDCSTPSVPTEISFRLQSEIISENFVLAAGRAEARGGNSLVDRRVGLLDHVAAREAIGPDAAKLIEVIETPARHEIQFFQPASQSLAKTRRSRPCGR